MTPLVSVGIPTYNNPEGLRKTLACITNQSYKNLEIIVSDNCSTNPEVQNVIREFADDDLRIVPYQQECNLGADDNYWFTRKHATGKYLMNAQDDDWWSHSFIEKLVEGLEQTPGIPVAICPTQYIMPDGKRSELHTLKNLSVFNAVGNGDLGIVCMGLWNRKEMTRFEISFPDGHVYGPDHIMAALVLMVSGRVLVVDSERYVKGLTPGKFEDCFKYDFWYSFRSWYWMMKVLFQSPHIPIKRKVFLPFIAVTNFIRACGITGVQVIVSLPDNPVKSIVQRRFFGVN